MLIDPHSPQPSAIQKAAQTIRDGGIVLHPSDTIYGLACDPFQNAAIERLIALKGRAERKGFLLLIPEVTWIEKLTARVPKIFYQLTENLWPGAITFLLEANAGLSPLIRGEESKVGIRNPALPFLIEWMKAIPGPVVSTSANLSGHAPPQTLAELKELFFKKVDLFLEAGEVEKSEPSTVLDLTVDPPRVAREGRDLRHMRKVLSEMGRAGSGTK